MIFLLVMNGMLTSVSNNFFPLSDSTRLQITYNIHLCMFKQVNRDGARYELGWTSMGVCVCVCVCYVVHIRFLGRYVLPKTPSKTVMVNMVSPPIV